MINRPGFQCETHPSNERHYVNGSCKEAWCSANLTLNTSKMFENERGKRHSQLNSFPFYSLYLCVVVIREGCMSFSSNIFLYFYLFSKSRFCMVISLFCLISGQHPLLFAMLLAACIPGSRTSGCVTSTHHQDPRTHAAPESPSAPQTSPRLTSPTTPTIRPTSPTTSIKTIAIMPLSLVAL